MPDNPLKPFPLLVQGGSNSVVGDSIKVVVYGSSGAKGVASGVLDSNKELMIDLSNSNISVADGDTLVVTEIGSAIGGIGITANGAGADVQVTGTAVAFPSRSL
jgi:hypothetical protein